MPTGGRVLARESPVVYMYVLGASSSPDRVECTVPWEVDERTIFFGPCKKALRHHLKQEVLGDHDDVVPPSDIFVIGFNKLPRDGQRRIVWAGRVTRVMTFARAHDLLSDPRYAKMLASKQSPMNVEPIRARNSGHLLGYMRRPNGTHPKSWPWDLVTTMRRVDWHGDELRLTADASPTRAFRRDACFTAENIFFANGAGLAIDEAFVRILTDAQPWARDIDAVAVFGRVNGTAEGLRGRYLTLSGGDAERVVEWLRRHPACGPRRPSEESAPSARRSPRACR